MNQRKTLNYKGLRVNLMGLPVSERNNNKREQRKKMIYLRSFLSFGKENSPKNLLVVFDIPEKMRKEREWFRRQLVNLGFVLIQKSVWVGPSPLPKCFIEYLSELGLKNKFKTFKLNKPYKKN